MPDGEKPDGELPDGEAPADVNGEAPSGEAPSDAGPSGDSDSADDSSEDATTYATAADYIASLNGDSAWIEYDESTNKATITGLAGFVNAYKSPSKDVCAFDDLNRSQAENAVFGNANNESLHFSATVAELLADNAEAYAELSDWDDSYPDEYASDREYVDDLGKTSDERQAMYDPMHYLGAGEGVGESTPAAHWRIRTGIEQGDTACTTEINLALALAACDDVADVDFATVWGQGHTMAERTGSSTDNFIAWVKSCCE